MSDPSLPPKTERPWLPWAVSGAAFVLALLVLLAGLLPARSRAAEAELHAAQVQKELDATRAAAAEERSKVEALLRDQENLSQERTAIAERLAAAVKEKEEAVAALAAAKKDLSSTLESQIATGDVLIKERLGELVVDVSDQLLFDIGATELNEKGKDLLKRVATSMKRLHPRQVFQVGGHTDSQRVVSKELVERYPTNWELSAARATNVARFLQETGNVPGRQLVAAGFSQYRPASSNATEAGRKRNRRIEIVLLKNKR